MGRSSLKRGYNMAALWEEREKDDGRATFFQCFNNILDDEKLRYSSSAICCVTLANERSSLLISLKGVKRGTNRRWKD